MLSAQGFAQAVIAPLPQVGTPGNAVLRVGTEVPLRLSEELTTKGKTLRVGNRFHLQVSEPVVVNGVTVIPSGSQAVGEITDVRNKGMWGKSGKLNARVLYVIANGRQIRLTGGFDDKGTAGRRRRGCGLRDRVLAGRLFHDRHQRENSCRDHHQGICR